MIQYIVWAITFITLWLIIIWLHYLDAEQTRKEIKGKVSIGIPVFSRNNDKDAIKTIASIFSSGYPKELLEVIVVDDGSADNTLKLLQDYKKKHPELPLQIYHKTNGGKASALNVALKHATGDYFAVVDADSSIGKNSIQTSLSNFADKTTGAVISRVKVDEAKNFLEVIQKVEYMMSALVRKIMSNFGTLAITPGVLSMYRTNTLHKIGGFTTDRENLTEDLEIALRLKANGYNIIMEDNSITYTAVPSTLSQLWRQRVRWTRGYLYNHWNYRGLFFNTKHGTFGVFQLPINVLAVVLLIINVSIISFDLGHRGYDFISRSIAIPDYFWTTLTQLPNLQEFILARNINITIPLFISLALGLYLWWYAHQRFGESVRKNLLPIASYMLVMPYFSAANWISSIYQEATKAKRKW